MQIFQLFCKLFMKRLPVTWIYIGAFLAISIGGSMSQGNQNTNYEEASLNIAVIDRDHSPASEGLVQYLGKLHTIKDLEDNKEAMQDELFYRNVEYIAVVPKGFEEGLSSGNPAELDVIKVPGSMEGMYVDRQVNSFCRFYITYLKSGFDIAESLMKTMESLGEKPEVLNINSASGKAPAYEFYFSYLSYALMAILFFALGGVMVIVNKPEVRKRTLCSSLNAGNRNLQLAAAFGVIALVVWGVFQLFAVLIYRGEMLSDPNYPYYVLNSLIFTLTAAALSLLIGTALKTRDAVNGVSNICSLGLSFLGGIFVPQEILGETVLKIAHFIPSFWTMKVINLLSGTSGLNENTASVFWGSILVQLAFFGAILGAALVVGKYKRYVVTR